MANNIFKKLCPCGRTHRSAWEKCGRCRAKAAQELRKQERAEDWNKWVSDKLSAQDRACLCCSNVFRSEGKHNRICRACKSQRDMYDLAETGRVSGRLLADQGIL